MNQQYITHDEIVELVEPLSSNKTSNNSLINKPEEKPKAENKKNSLLD